MRVMTHHIQRKLRFYKFHRSRTPTNFNYIDINQPFQTIGIVPMFCEELFTGIEAKKGGETTFEVKFSMLEIYNEIARDLLDANGAKKKSGLKIRQHPKKGFYGK